MIVLVVVWYYVFLAWIIHAARKTHNRVLIKG